MSPSRNGSGMKFMDITFALRFLQQKGHEPKKRKDQEDQDQQEEARILKVKEKQQEAKLERVAPRGGATSAEEITMLRTARFALREKLMQKQANHLSKEEEAQELPKARKLLLVHQLTCLSSITQDLLN